MGSLVIFIFCLPIILGIIYVFVSPWASIFGNIIGFIIGIFILIATFVMACFLWLVLDDLPAMLKDLQYRPKILKKEIESSDKRKVSFNQTENYFVVDESGEKYYFDKILMVVVYKDGKIVERFRGTFGMSFQEDYDETGIRVYYTKPEYYIEIKTTDETFLKDVYNEIVSVIKTEFNI